MTIQCARQREPGKAGPQNRLRQAPFKIVLTAPNQLQAVGRYLVASVVPAFLSPQFQRLPASVVINANLPPRILAAAGAALRMVTSTVAVDPVELKLIFCTYLPEIVVPIAVSVSGPLGGGA